jgi:site-specific DNA-cytosine methylase
MFSGIGGFELGIQRAFSSTQGEGQPTETPTGNKERLSEQLSELSLQGLACVGYSEIDKYAIKVYERQFNGKGDNGRHIQEQTTKNLQNGSTDIEGGESGQPKSTERHINFGDATAINPTDLPDFDLLVGGFPCQAFSIAGKRNGFNDTRGTLFFDIARILAEKRPRHLVLENVKGLLSHDSGKTFQTILGVLSDLGYRVEWQVLNSKDFGVPQNRERIYIVGHLGGECSGQVFPIGNSKETVNKVGVQKRPRSSTQPIWRVSDSEKSRRDILSSHQIRRLTPLECERLQGFPDNWTALGIGEEPISDTQRYKMCGNAVTVNTVQAVMERLIEHDS